MYNEIEELEKQLNRKPAATPLVKPDPIDVAGDLRPNQLTYAPTQRIFDLPDATKFDKESPRLLPSQAGQSESVVGGVAPDYSGYDDILSKLEGKRPKDTSLADLITMGATTGLAALMGRASIGMKNAGDYGMDRFNKAEKKDDELEKMILTIQAQKAAKMAAGKKGTKVKSGSGADAYGKAYQNRYLDSDGNLRTPQFMNDQGRWVQDESDPVYKIPNIGTLDRKESDGRVVQHAQMGPVVKKIGSLDPQLKTEKTATGELAFVNDRSKEITSLGDHFNKTAAGLSPHSDQAYKSISDKVMSDPLLRGLEGSYNDMSLGMTALGRGDIGGALAATKMAASALEKGRMTSDKDLAQVSNINLGLATKAENLLMSFMEGGKITEDGRRELESLFSLIEANSRDAYARRVKNFNKKASTMLGREYHEGLAFPDLPKFTGKKQDKLIDTSVSTAKDTMSTGEWDQQLVIAGKPIFKDGKPVMVKMRMKNGKPFAQRVLE